MKTEVDEFVQKLWSTLNYEFNSIISNEKVEEISSPEIMKAISSKEDEIEIANILTDLENKNGCHSNLDNDVVYNSIDTLINSLISDIFNMYSKVRRSIKKSHSLYILLGAVKKHPEFWDNKISADNIDLIQSYFLDSIEVAYFRMSSFWDRVGQLYDFVFFNIRNYDRDCYTEVITRVYNNIAVVNKEFSDNCSFKNIWNYSRDESNKGLKWLFQRRNIITHSVSISSRKLINVVPVYSEPIINHFEQKREKKLKLESEDIEIGYLHAHYDKLCLLFKDIFSLALLASNG